MLGKRTLSRTGSFAKYPQAKKKYTKRDNQFGPGYNPKQVSVRPAPPNAELKWNDTTGIVTTWVASGSGLPSHAGVDSLVRISQGDQGYQRNGSKITVKKITIRGACEAYGNSNATFSSTTPGEVYFRWMIFVDTQANGAFPTVTDIFEETPTGADVFDIYNSLTETGRFKVLMDKFIRVNEACPMFNTNTQHTHVQNRLTHFKKTINVNLPIHYSDSSSNMAAVRNNNIFMLIFNGHDGSNLGFSYRARVRFTDY